MLPKALFNPISRLDIIALLYSTHFHLCRLQFDMGGPVTIGVTIGIAAGGVVLVCGVCILSIRLILRRKYKRRMAKIDTEIEGRLSRIASSHMHISDEDVARIPGTNATARLQDYYSRSPYTPMASRETPESRPDLKSLQSTESSTREGQQTVTPVQSWPLPRRLTRSDGTPLANTPVSSTSPKKKHKNQKRCSSRTTEKESKDSFETNARPTSLEIIQNKLDNPTSPNAGLKPKPLFHNKPRSISHGMISRLGQNTTNTNDPGIKSFSKSCHPRSVSVCSQEPGAAPTHVLPPLPFELVPKGKKSAKSPPDFSACESLFSDNSSVLNDQQSTVLSQAETNPTSVGLASPQMSSPISEAPMKGLGLWDIDQEKASPINNIKALKLRPQLNTQKSFRGSVRYSLPRSESSGLSMSLLDQASHPGSNANSPRRGSQANPKPKVSSPSQVNGKPTHQQASRQPSPLKHDINPEREEDLRCKRASISVLCPISGNQGAPLTSPDGKHRSSIATDDPFRWDLRTSVPAGMRTGVQNGDKCQSYSRIEESDEQSRGEKSSDIVVYKPKHMEGVFQPPSKPTFDVHFIPGRSQFSTATQTPPFSPTLAMFNFYERANSSPESAISTPTKKPNRQTSFDNRLSSIFDNPFTTSWRLSSPANEERLEQTRKDSAFQISSQSQHRYSDSAAPGEELRPPSSLFDFPNPPKRTIYPSWRRPKTPIRGPRAQPDNNRNSPTRRCLSHSASKSPPKSPSARISKAYGNSPSFDLRRSIMALRRQNSEVNNHQSRGSREHKRYLSIGDTSDKESAIFEDDRKENGGRSKGLKGSKTMPLVGERIEDGSLKRWGGPSGGPRVGTPMSFYDGDGFFKDT